MRLADFIRKEIDVILMQWDYFAAAQVPAATYMDSLSLRDHGRQILEAVATDIATTQTSDAQVLKSMGLAPKPVGASQTAAQTHAFLRANSGFDINQLAAEYRALRASVLRLWMNACAPELPDLQDVIRFNEAIDQALAESIAFFSARVEEARNLLLGMLGHDMRSPLQTIQATATYLTALSAGEEVSEAASRLVKSGARMRALLDDLVEFNRTKLGLGIHVVRAKADLRGLFGDELAQLRAIYPQHPMELDVSGDTIGFWDGARLQQLLNNLVVNAIKYGSSKQPVRITVRGDEHILHFDVKNSGVIDQRTLAQLFEPLKRGLELAPGRAEHGSLGLGLYLAREIAKAHGGEIEARSDNAETVFAVYLPRQPSNAIVGATK